MLYSERNGSRMMYSVQGSIITTLEFPTEARGNLQSLCNLQRRAAGCRRSCRPQTVQKFRHFRRIPCHGSCLNTHSNDVASLDKASQPGRLHYPIVSDSTIAHEIECLERRIVQQGVRQSVSLASQPLSVSYITTSVQPELV
jgi:hypothetical protein